MIKIVILFKKSLLMYFQQTLTLLNQTHQILYKEIQHYKGVFLNKMGQSLCNQAPYQNNDLSLDPFASTFNQIQPFQISPQINSLLDKIKKLNKDIIDPRNNQELKNYQSTKYPFKLLGSIKSRRPCGQCIFYFDQNHQSNNTPIQQQVQSKQTKNNNEGPNQQIKFAKTKKFPLLITTSISPHYTFSPFTLIIYQDYSYYVGEIVAKMYQVPKATGHGMLVTKEFIYEGQFDDGFPQGYGHYRTKSVQYTGWIRKGLPNRECIEKTSKGMFIGKIDDKRKVGFLITPENKRIQVNQTLINNTGISL